MTSGRGLRAHPAFARFWLADAASNFGTFVSGLALQLLLIEHLHADQTDLGLVRAAQWLPYLLFGMLAGVLVDRLRRRPVLIAADAVCALLLGAVAALAVTERLTVPLLTVIVFVVGAASMFFRAAHQSLLPDLVPLPLLPSASSRLEQTMSATQAAGPLAAGALVRWLSAPIAVAIDAASYAVSALLLRTVAVSETPKQRRRIGLVWSELVEGARWVYRHRTLAPYAISLHLWFFFNSVVTTVLVFYAAVDLELNALAIGGVLACAGVSGVIGAGVAPRIGGRIGEGRLCVLADWLCPIGYLFVLLARPGPGAIVLLVVAELIYGLGLGLKGPPETSYRSAVTPHRLRGRMNATVRSVNWGSIAVSAPLAGWCATMLGNRPVIAAGIAGLAIAAMVVTLSPFRSARLPTTDDDAAATPPPGRG